MKVRLALLLWIEEMRGELQSGVDVLQGKWRSGFQFVRCSVGDSEGGCAKAIVGRNAMPVTPRGHAHTCTLVGGRCGCIVSM